jgi:hypothetical protein
VVVKEACERAAVAALVIFIVKEALDAKIERVRQIMETLKRKCISCAAGVSNAILCIKAAKSGLETRAWGPVIVLPFLYISPGKV